MTYDKDILKDKLLALKIFDDNNYLDKYIELIESNRETKKEKFKTQKHHIIPRCYFKHENLEIDNSSDNLVNLLYKDHALAHYYLSLCCKGVFKYANEYALLHLINYKTFPADDYTFIKTLDKYQSVYESYILHDRINHLGKKLSEETKKKISLSSKGRKLSEETRKKMSDANIGKVVSDATKNKLSLINKGKRLSNETRLKIGENGGKNKGRVYVNNGTITKCVDLEQLNDYLTLGYVKGRTPEYCSNLSNSKKGHTVSQDTRNKIGKSNKGRKFPNTFGQSIRLRMNGKNSHTI
ncbi:NUMOD3 domain-containing DNA-binding protein [uncultured Clostridium sp.]|uniref:NUMOD3 domain-containing DNA-binding protein n=1 Tax=uncultured Clostridium sp. TaxID=59620 RepID=UPI002607EBE9|nr:NUMOD3 domain-containing DNA-binding protein [uncultured Clostridium sp.]